MIKKPITREDSIIFLKLLIEKADELHNRSYFDGGQSIMGFTIDPSNKEGQSVDFYYPDDEKRDSILLILRLFWQKNDFLYYRNFLEIFDFMHFSKEWESEIDFLIKTLDIQFEQNCVSGNVNYSHKDVFEICLYGNVSHLSQREKYIDLTHNGEITELIDSIFHELILKFSCTMMSLANASRKEMFSKGIISKDDYEIMQRKWKSRATQNGNI